jgi:hypothetical protein
VPLVEAAIQTVVRPCARRSLRQLRNVSLEYPTSVLSQLVPEIELLYNLFCRIPPFFDEVAERQVASDILQTADDADTESITGVVVFDLDLCHTPFAESPRSDQF